MSSFVHEGYEYYIEPKKTVIIENVEINRNYSIYRKPESDGEAEMVTNDILNSAFGEGTKIIWSHSDNTYVSNNENTFVFSPPFARSDCKIYATFENKEQYNLEAEISFLPEKWKGLKSWLAGIAAKLVTTASPSMAATYYKFNDNTILPVFSFKELNKCPYACIVAEPVLQNTFTIYISDQEFEYQSDDGLVVNYSNNIYTAQVNVNKDNKWSTVEHINYDKVAIEPLWASHNIKDKEGLIKIKTYSPILIYGSGGSDG